MVTARHLFAFLSLVIGIGWLANLVARAPREGDRSPASIARESHQRDMLARLRHQQSAGRFMGPPRPQYPQGQAGSGTQQSSQPQAQQPQKPTPQKPTALQPRSLPPMQLHPSHQSPARGKTPPPATSDYRQSLSTIAPTIQEFVDIKVKSNSPLPAASHDLAAKDPLKKAEIDRINRSVIGIVALIQSRLPPDRMGLAEDFQRWWLKPENQTRFMRASILEKMKDLPVGALVQLAFATYSIQDANEEMVARAGDPEALKQIGERLLQDQQAWGEAARGIPGTEEGVALSKALWAGLVWGFQSIGGGILESVVEVGKFVLIGSWILAFTTPLFEPFNQWLKSKADFIMRHIRRDATTTAQAWPRKGAEAEAALAAGEKLDPELVVVRFPSKRSPSQIAEFYSALGQVMSLQMSQDGRLLHPDVAAQVEAFLRDGIDFPTANAVESATISAARASNFKELHALVIPKLIQYGVPESEIRNTMSRMQEVWDLWISHGLMEPEMVKRKERQIEGILRRWQSRYRIPNSILDGWVGEFRRSVNGVLDAHSAEVSQTSGRLLRVFLDPQSGRGLVDGTGLRRNMEAIRHETGFYTNLREYRVRVQAVLDRMGFGTVLNVNKFLEAEGRGPEYMDARLEELRDLAKTRHCFYAAALEAAEPGSSATGNLVRRMVNRLRNWRRSGAPIGLGLDN